MPLLSTCPYSPVSSANTGTVFLSLLVLSATNVPTARLMRRQTGTSLTRGSSVFLGKHGLSIHPSGNNDGSESLLSLRPASRASGHNTRASYLMLLDLGLCLVLLLWVGLTHSNISWSAMVGCNIRGRA